MKISLLKLLAVAVGGVLTVQAATLDSNFQETTFANVGSDADVTGIAWAPDGSNRLFVARKNGVIHVIKNGIVLGTPFATVSPVFQNSECGLIGICFDPNFIGNGYVYVFVTVSSSEQQIIRYRAVGDMGTNKTVIVPGLPTIGDNHDGGGIGIGPDGRLYWSIGDNGNGAGVDLNLTSLASKVGRANLNGSVALDNPFVDGGGGNNDYIWARGFRNPFTLTFQPATGDLWVNVAGDSYEQIFLVSAGDHAGWNDFENNQPGGYILPKIKYRTGSVDARGLAAGTGAVRANNLVTFTTTSTHGFRLGEKIAITGVANSSFNSSVYVASIPGGMTFTAAQASADATSGGGTATTLNQGSAVSGGCFFDCTGAPEPYRGNFFYGDYVSDRIMRATLSSSNTVQTVDYFVTGSSSQIDVAVGPDSALYSAEHDGIIHRLAYTNFTTQQLLLTPITVRMVEAGKAAVTVRLAIAPLADVTVNTTRTAGDTDIEIIQGTVLTFTPGNWSSPQSIILQANADEDVLNDAATLTVSAPGVTSELVTVHAVDSPAAPVLTVISGQPGAVQIGLNGQPGERYVLEGNTNFSSPWLSLRTNILAGNFTNILDAAAGNLPLRFYRARLAP